MHFFVLLLIPAIFADWSPVVPNLAKIQYKSSFAISSWRSDRYNLFVRGTDDALYYKTWDNGKWNDWESLGGSIRSRPAAISWKPRKIAVFVKGADDSIWARWYEHNNPGMGTWGDWFSLNTKTEGAPTVCSWGPERMDLFYKGADNSLMHKYWTGGDPTLWSAEEKLGGNLASNPSCVSWGDQRIDVFARDGDNKLVQRSFDGDNKWLRWKTHETLATGETPVVASRKEGTLDVFVRRVKKNNPSTPIMMKSFGGDLTSFLGIKGIVIAANPGDWTPFFEIKDIRTASNPAVVSSKKGEYRMAFWNNDGVQYHSDFEGKLSDIKILTQDSEASLDSSEPSLDSGEASLDSSEASLDSGEATLGSSEVSQSSIQEPRTNGIYIPNALVGVIIGVAVVVLVVVAGLVVVLYKATRTSDIASDEKSYHLNQ